MISKKLDFQNLTSSRKKSKMLGQKSQDLFVFFQKVVIWSYSLVVSNIVSPTKISID